MSLPAKDLFVVDERLSGAHFSPCRKWRYRLWRSWGNGPYVNFLMLNPSTADELELDPTCTRCRDFSMLWEHGGMIVTNLFAWRATEPEDMKKASDPVGPENNEHILEVASGAGVVVCAWGNHGTFQARVDHVLNMLRAKSIKLHALKINGTGQPAHPLYLPGNLKPVPFR